MDTARPAETGAETSDGLESSGSGLRMTPGTPVAVITATAASMAAESMPDGPKTQNITSDVDRDRLSFSLLPVELQDEIWTRCLPHRIVELCPQAGLASHHVPQYANPRWQYNKQRHRQPTLSRPPVVAGVCFAARSTSRKNGCWMSGANGTPVWVDLQRDTVMLNGERLADYTLLEEKVCLGSNSVQDGFARDAHSSAAVGITSPTTNHRHQLLACMHLARGGVAVAADMLRSHMSRVLYPLLESCARPPRDGSGENSAVSTKDAYSASGGCSGARMVFFDEIVLQGTRKQAVESGLFGWSPDQDTFLVRISDSERLRQICAMAQRARNQPDALHIGNIGFLRGLLQHRQEAKNRKLLEESYIIYQGNVLGWPLSLEQEVSALAHMPRLDQAVLFRFSEITTEEAERRKKQRNKAARWQLASPTQS